MKISQKTDVKIKRFPDFSPRVSNARIKVICGPMFSGKTKSLISAINEEKSQGKTVFVFKPKLDDRYAEEAIVSHDKDEVGAFSVERPKEILDLYLNADVVAIDEVQFFDESVVKVCDTIANAGKSVIVAGLDMDYRSEAFGPMPQLLTLADEVVKLNSVCTFCSGRARYSHRISEEDGIVVLGEKNKYVPLCRSCYSELK
ncbi:MAG: thymidine kinase [Flavobacteriales bacterium]|nr:thymidine kinase [Flavobacteriales bacterium]